MKSKIIIVVLIIILATSTYYNIKHINNEKEKEHLFLNFTHTYITDVKYGLETLKDSCSTGNYDSFDHDINYVVENIYLLDQLLHYGSFFFDEEIVYSHSIPGFKHIGYAFEGKLKNKYQGSFTADGIISKKEIKFINQLSKDLEVLLSTVVGEDGLNVNPNLSITSFSKELNVFYDKWHIFPEKSSLNYSPYDYLLIE